MVSSMASSTPLEESTETSLSVRPPEMARSTEVVGELTTGATPSGEGAHARDVPNAGSKKRKYPLPPFVHSS